jgi:hypothetical protein
MAAELVARRRVKTKLCHAWLRTGGRCPRGDACQFSHGTEELRVFQEPRNGKAWTRICRVWLDSCGRYCPHADKCLFCHGVHMLKIRVPPGAHVGGDATRSGGEDAATVVSGSAYADGDGSSSTAHDADFETLISRSRSVSAASAASGVAHGLLAGPGGRGDVAAHIAALSMPPVGSAGNGPGQPPAPPSPASAPTTAHSPPAPGLAPAAAAALTSAPSHAPTGWSAKGGDARGFKPQVCRAWLQAAADAAAGAAASLMQTGAAASSDLSQVATAALRQVHASGCARGEACPYAHSVAELKLPTNAEHSKALTALMCESPGSPVLQSATTAAPGQEPCLSLREQALLFVASGLQASSLPPALASRMGAVLSLGGSHRALVRVAGVDEPMPSAFADLPPALATALAAAVDNPVLQVLMPHGRDGFGGGSPGSPGHDGGIAGGTNGSARMGLARIIATVGHDAADVALVTAAVALGIVRVHLGVLARGQPAATAGAEGAAAAGLASWKRGGLDP